MRGESPEMSLELLIACLEAYSRSEDTEPWVTGVLGSSAMPIPEGYKQAVDDLLTGLGILKEGRIQSQYGYLFAQSLIHGLREGAFTPEMWSGATDSTCTSTGPALLEQLESHRLHCAHTATPIRRVSAVMAVIKARRGDSDVYLMQYDHNAGQFQPLGGKVDADDPDNLSALARELREELNQESLTAGRDYVIAPLKENIQSFTLSASLHVVTEYNHNFYHLESVNFPLPIDAETCWISREELHAGRTLDQRSVSRLMVDELDQVLDQLPYSLNTPIA